jgi:hypothetical protein
MKSNLQLDLTNNNVIKEKRKLLKKKDIFKHT